MKQLIGTIHLPAKTIHVSNYATASWYTTFEHEAQTCKITLQGKFAHYAIEGRTTYRYFPSSFGGNIISSGSSTGPCDLPDTHHVQVYEYLMIEAAERGDIQLAPGVEIAYHTFDHPVTCLGRKLVKTPQGPLQTGYVPCDCTHHLDAHRQPTRTERSERGFLPFGYVPDAIDRKRHGRFTFAHAAA